MRAGAKLQGSVRNADARSARARQGRVKIEARAGAAAFDISPSFRSGGRYAQAKSRRLSRSEARCRACRGNSDAPASATRVGGERYTFGSGACYVVVETSRHAERRNAACGLQFPYDSGAGGLWKSLISSLHEFLNMWRRKHLLFYRGTTTYQ